MREINEPIRVAYAAKLLQIPNMGVYYQNVPNNLNPDNYIVFRSITNTDASTKTSSEVNLNIVVEIHTKGLIANNGMNPDTIADMVYQLIYPNKQTNLILSRGQVVQTQLVNDRVMDYSLKNQFGYIDRFITFNHLIFIEGAQYSGGAGVMSPGRVFRIEYTGVGGETYFVDPRLINKNILNISKDGVDCSKIITAGTPVDKQAKYDTLTGRIDFAMALEPNEEIIVLYQN